MTFTNQLIETIVIFLCMHMIIARICQCVEYKALAKAYETAIINNPKLTVDDCKKEIAEVKNDII